jgi:hypothetical protein
LLKLLLDQVGAERDVGRRRTHHPHPLRQRRTRPGFLCLSDLAPEVPDDTTLQTLTTICLHCFIDKHPEIGQGLDLADKPTAPSSATTTSRGRSAIVDAQAGVTHVLTRREENDRIRFEPEK